MREGYGFFERRRKALSALFVIPAVGLVFITHHSWEDGSTLDILFDVGAVLFVVIGILGRAWSTAYIGGKKNSELVVKGPYSMTRNPLYLFSFIAGLGVCVEMKNIYLIIAYLILFPLSYHYVIGSEEKRLAGLFGKEFDDYRRSTPAFFPNVFRLDMGKIDTVAPGLLKKTLRDGSVFVLLLVFIRLVEYLQESGVLSVVWRVP